MLLTDGMTIRNYRLAYEAGEDFINQHLYMYSDDEEDFTTRRQLAYCPAYAKALINEVKTKLASQLHTITRVSDKRVLERYAGKDGGVNGADGTMTTFIISELLPELLPMGKVGVLVEGTPTGPAYKVFKREQILEYKYTGNKLTYLKLLDGDNVHTFTKDDVVTYTLHTSGEKVATSTLDIDFIPFEILDIKQPLMAEIWRHQVALLNIEASDVYYIYKANYPRYTEQRDRRSADVYAKSDSDLPKKQKHGVLKGRVYDVGTDRPGFIHPSPDPLYASMQKENQIKEQMARLVDVSLSELGGEGVDSGLASIAAELERGENALGRMFAKMLLVSDFTAIYPTVFTLKSDDDRIEEATKLSATMASVPSVTYRKEVCKQTARLILQGKISADKLAAIEAEIEALPVIIQDPDKLVEHVETGIIDRVSAALASGYTAEGAIKAMEEKISLMQHIVAAQVSKLDVGARAGGDRETGTTAASDEKKISQDKAVTK